jgi:hypothetical protein
MDMPDQSSASYALHLKEDLTLTNLLMEWNIILNAVHLGGIFYGTHQVIDEISCENTVFGLLGRECLARGHKLDDNLLEFLF